MEPNGGSVSAPIAQMTGPELQRSLLYSVREWEARIEYIKGVQVHDLSDDDVERLVRDMIVHGNNLDQVVDKISLELGLPIS